MRGGDGARRGVTGADENRALDTLRWNWGDAYHIGYDGGEWWYRRRDGKGGRETAASACELYRLIADDYAVMPVPRDPAVTGHRGLRLVPDEPDQVPRLTAFRAAHPGVFIGSGEFGTWQALIPEASGEMVVTRYRLAELLDRLDELTGGQP